MISEPCLKSHGHQQAASSCCASTNDHARDPIVCSDSICYQRSCAISRPENTSSTHHLRLQFLIEAADYSDRTTCTGSFRHTTHIFLSTMPPPFRSTISHFSLSIISSLSDPLSSPYCSLVVVPAVGLLPSRLPQNYPMHSNTESQIL